MQYTFPNTACAEYTQDLYWAAAVVLQVQFEVQDTELENTIHYLTFTHSFSVVELQDNLFAMIYPPLWCRLYDGY